MLSGKPVSTVVIESIVVGALLVCFYMVVSNINHGEGMLLINLFISGAIFHLAFEYTGLNLWYVREYNKLLK